MRDDITFKTDIVLSGPKVKPATGKKARQLVVFLHGLGADGNDLIGLANEFSAILPEAIFVSPNAPFPCDMAPYGYQWFSLREWTPQSMLKGAKAAYPILNNFIDSMLREFELSDRNMALIGFSQGTMMALYTALRRKEACAGIVGYSGAILDTPETLPDNIVKPEICLIHGMMDNIVPYIALENAIKILKYMDVPFEYHTRPLLGHSIDFEGIEIAKKFLKKIFF